MYTPIYMCVCARTSVCMYAWRGIFGSACKQIFKFFIHMHFLIQWQRIDSQFSYCRSESSKITSNITFLIWMDSFNMLDIVSDYICMCHFIYMCVCIYTQLHTHYILVCNQRAANILQPFSCITSWVLSWVLPG